MSAKRTTTRVVTEAPPRPRSSSKKRFSSSTLAVAAVLIAAFVYQVTPYLIEVQIHSCDCYLPNEAESLFGVARSVWRFVSDNGFVTFSDHIGQAARSLLGQTPFYSFTPSQNKTVLMIGGSYIKEFFTHTAPLRVNIHLIDDPKMVDIVDRRYVQKFIPIEDFGRVSIKNRQFIIDTIVNSGVKYDGVFTLVEDEGPLAAQLARVLGLPGNTELAADIARNKFKVRQLMEAAGLRTPKFALIETEADLEHAGAHVGFPAFLKPVWGVAASFSNKVSSPEDLRQTFFDNQAHMSPEISGHSIYHYGSQMILEGKLGGTEIQLELMLYNGSVIYHCFSSEYDASRRWLVFPVNLTQEAQDELLKLATDTVLAIGLSNGVVHIEMFYSEEGGAQLIEVNNRLSRGFLPAAFLHQLGFGEQLTDYFASVVFLSLGMEPPIYPREEAPISMAIFPDRPSKTGWETQGPCAVFIAPTPFEALQQGLRYVGLQ
eukprot:TRINITY_DN23264_c0_g1_i1.p1 TRINITY_DN23264_c0_g1~~TRINITY_DN23264_c0_g1_i1.p1  ORF type:complete len:487 (-),score=115.79 TRINITY_DN23264_c0_g1_i1:518-1978(-)